MRIADLKSSLALRLIWLTALIGTLIISNPGVFQRITIVIEEGKHAALLALAVVWSLSVFATLVVVTSPSLALRAVWGVLIGASTASAMIFLGASGAALTIFDLLSLWNARHEAGHAITFHRINFAFGGALGAFLLGLIVASPFKSRVPAIQKFSWYVPLVPILAIMTIVYSRDGQGSSGLPQQYAPLGMAALLAPAISLDQTQTREAVKWQPGHRLAEKIVLVVDESVRSDHIDWTAGNAITPQLASVRDRIVDFGPAASGSNCSSYSNAILRFGARRNDLIRSVRTNAPIWQFAKAAGYKTAFIDAQAELVRKYGIKFQNFMTGIEARDIDDLIDLDPLLSPHELDDQLADKILDLLRLPGPVFIYANKAGAHFPYDDRYPASAREFRPTMQDEQSARGRINSYKNAIRWSVDRVIARLLWDAPSDNLVLIYTSDHGQNLAEGRLSHCVVHAPDPSEAIVPLFVSTTMAPLKGSFVAAADEARGHFSHFDIPPTLMKLMGYSPDDVIKDYGSSLLKPALHDRTAFSSGDIFGIFSSKVRWTEMDLPERARHAATIRSAQDDPGQ